MESSKASMLLSSLGWILLVIGAGVFLWYGRPYFYEQGRMDQFESDVQTVDAYLYAGTGQQPGTPDQPVVGILSSIEGDKLMIRTEQALINPLVPERDSTKTVLLTAETEIVIGHQLTTEQFQARFQQAQANGGNLSDLSPVNQVPGTLADLELGDRIAVYLPEGQDRGASSFTAMRIEHLAFHGQPIEPPAELQGIPQIPNPQL